MNAMDLLMREGELRAKAARMGLCVGAERMITRCEQDDRFLCEVEYTNLLDLNDVDEAGTCAECGKLCFTTAPQYSPDGKSLRYVHACPEHYEKLCRWPEEQ